MKWWRRVIVESERPLCGHVVRVMMLTRSASRQREFITLLDVQSSCATVQCLIRPQVMYRLHHKEWTPTLSMGDVFSHRNHTVPLCCRMMMHAAWDALKKAPPR